MKYHADSRRTNVKYDIGDWVYFRLQLYRKQTIFRRVHHKLSTRHFGSFEIIKKN